MPAGKFHITLVLLIMFLPGINYAQDYAAVDRMVKQYSPQWNSPEDLAKQISHDFSTAEEKARAIYDWIALNITYDIEKYFSQGLFTAPYYAHSLINTDENYYIEDLYRVNMAEDAMYTKTTLCEGYASLYKRLCDLAGVECVIIPGYVKILPSDIGRKPTAPNHTWNAVRINGQWRLLDVTWGAGKLNYEKKIFVPEFSDMYFFVPPERFFLQHCPEKATWSFTGKTVQDFITLPYFYREYLSAGIEIIKPVKGIFYSTGKVRIRFRIKNFSKDSSISYSIRENSPAIKIHPVQKSEWTTFTVSLHIRHETYLTLFMDGYAIVVYKLIRQ